MTESAPAKLTLSLRVTGVRDDGMHELLAEMVTIDLADVLTFSEGSGLTVIDGVVGDLGIEAMTDDNLVEKASWLWDVMLRSASPSTYLLGRVSEGALRTLLPSSGGEGSRARRSPADYGADVPFCLVGGRARVAGIGDRVTPLPFEDRRFVLLLPPVSVDTGAVYKAWDYLKREDCPATDAADSGNDLEDAALVVAPQSRHWRDTFAGITGKRPRLAGR